MNWRRNVQPREQRTMSRLEMLVGFQSYAQRLQAAAKTLIDYFTPRAAEEIKDGHRSRAARRWIARHRATGAEAKRLSLIRLQKKARRIRASRHAKSGRPQ